jgi:hypothetical protein
MDFIVKLLLLSDRIHFLLKPIFKNIRGAITEVFMVSLDYHFLLLLVDNLLKYILFLLPPTILLIKNRPNSHYVDRVY